MNSPHLGGDDLGQRGLAKAGRAGEQDVVERLAARCGGLDGDLQLGLDGVLTDEVLEVARPQRSLERLVLGPGSRRVWMRSGPASGGPDFSVTPGLP